MPKFCCVKLQAHLREWWKSLGKIYLKTLPGSDLRVARSTRGFWEYPWPSPSPPNVPLHDVYWSRPDRFLSGCCSENNRAGVCPYVSIIVCTAFLCTGSWSRFSSIPPTYVLHWREYDHPGSFKKAYERSTKGKSQLELTDGWKTLMASIAAWPSCLKPNTKSIHLLIL